MPYCAAVRPTRKAISPRFAMRMDLRGSGDSEDVAVVDWYRWPLRASVAARRARILETDDMVCYGRLQTAV